MGQPIDQEPNEQPPTPLESMHRELLYIAIMLIVLPAIFHGVAQFADADAYARFFDPFATGSLVLAGFLTIVLHRLERYQLAWQTIIIFAIVCGFFTAGIDALGSGYSLTIYLIATFLALITLPRYGWQLVTIVSAIAVNLNTILEIRSLNTSEELWSAQISLLANVFIFFAGVFVVRLIQRHLNQQIESLHFVNGTLTNLNVNLKRSEHKSRILMETGLDPFFMIRPNGRILEVNQRACNLLGYSEQELLNQKVNQLAPRGTADQLQMMFDTMRKQGELTPLRTTLVKKDGSSFQAEVYGRILHLDDNPTMYVAARDITYHLAREQTIRENSDLLEMIAQNLPVRIAYFDSDSVLRFQNRAFAKTYRPNPNNSAVTDQAMLSTAEYAKRKPYIDQVMQGKPVTYELNEVLADGTKTTSQKTYVPHFDNGKVVGRVSLGIDITELRQIQQSLEESNALLDTVVNNMPARISYIDRAGEVLFVNDLVQEHFNLSAEEAIGRNVHDILPAAYLAAIAPYVKRAFRTGEDVLFESKVVHAGGAEVVERSYYYPQIVNGRVESIFTLHIDITEVRQAEDALAQAQKLESLGLLAGGIAHDFNNLLVAILGQSSLALNKIERNHAARRHIVQAISASNRASALTQQMLAYSGRGSFTTGLINMNKLIEGNLKLFAVSIPKNVHLTTSLEDELPLIDCDPTQMQQLIMNLIINAGQAIGEKNGTITVTTGVRTMSAIHGEFWEITGDPLIPGRYVSIQIQDDGSGMDETTLNQIFDPFFTTKESGTGLGLAAALGIIRGHKGGVHLYSEVGRGTVFHLLFPVSEEIDEMVVAVSPISAETAPSSDHAVLVIDDEIDILDVVSDMLELHNIRTMQASNGQDGIALYRQHTKEISLVLLDLMMPGMSGQDTFLALREINPDVQIILSSGYNEMEATRQFVGRGLADFIQKPYDFDTLISRVRAALDGDVVPIPASSAGA